MRKVIIEKLKYNKQVQELKKKNIIFLFKNCTDFLLKNKKNFSDKKFVKYHWDDRKKIFNDYRYLVKFYEKILNKISNDLNHYHQVNYSIRFWRILIGPWIYRFISSTFDKWETIKKLNFKEKYSVDIYNFNHNEFIPSALDDFIKMQLEDPWNLYINSSIIRSNFFSKNFKFNYKGKYKYKKKFVNNNLNFLKIFFNKLANRIYKNTILNSLYLSRRENFFLRINFKNYVNGFDLNLNQTENIKKSNFRKYNLDIKTFYKFEKYISQCIYKNLPKIFIEDFSNLENNLKSYKYSKNPKTILTSGTLSHDTMFSYYVARNVEKGSKLLIVQHGGCYGQFLFHSEQDHEIKISDKYLTWGWKDNKKKVIPFGSFNPIIKNKIYKDKEKKNLLIILKLPISYLSRLDSSMGVNQVFKYYEECINLVQQLKKFNIEKNIIIRTKNARYGFDEKKIWNSYFKDINLDIGKTQITELYEKSRVIIHTSIGTSYLETLRLNIPTIVYNKLDSFYLNKRTQLFFKKLKKEKIFFESEYEASKHINRIWKNTDEWWNNKSLQKVRQDFCEEYVRNNSDLSKNLKKIIS